MCVFFSDMSYDQMGTDLSQQPLLSSQIIPELDEDMFINKLVKPEAVMQKPVKVMQSIAPKIIQQKGATIQVKSNGIEHVAVGQKVQFLKRIPTNVVHISDPKVAVKQCGAAIGENAVTSTPIVINKVNGNISGMR